MSVLERCVDFKGYSTFLEIGLFYNSLRVKQSSFYRFPIHSADFLIFRRISVTRQFLVSLTSIRGKNIYCISYRKWI